MPPYIAPLRLASRPLPANCEPANDVLINLSSAFGTCIPTNLALVSTILGACSIVSWLFAQLPQVYRNYKLQSTSGLSIFFLTEWLLGDLSNLLGCVFTRQATWQVIIAIYYVFVDCALCGQWVWYAVLKHGRPVRSVWGSSEQSNRDGGSDMDQTTGGSQKTKAADTPSPKDPAKKVEQEVRPTANSSDDIPRRTTPFTAFRMPSYAEPTKDKEASANIATDGRPQVPSNLPMPSPSPRTILYISLLLAVLSNTSTATSIDPWTPSRIGLRSARYDQGQISATTSSSNTELAGKLLSWLSTVLYLGSRLPQLYMNHVRKSTAGLSPALFAAAFFGNLFYSTSLLTNPCAWYDFAPGSGRGWAGPEGSARADWVFRAAPFFLGAAGVLVMDAAVGIQFILYGEKDLDARGRSSSRSGDAHSEIVTYIIDANGVRKRIRRRFNWRRASGWMRGWVPAVSVGIAGTPSVSRASTPAGEGSASASSRLLSPGAASRANSTSSAGTSAKSKSIPIRSGAGSGSGALDEARALLREGVRHASPRSYGGV